MSAVSSMATHHCCPYTQLLFVDAEQCICVWRGGGEGARVGGRQGERESHDYVMHKPTTSEFWSEVQCLKECVHVASCPEVAETAQASGISRGGRS